jgi:hypothetical protein
MKIIRDGSLHLYIVIWQLRKDIFLARFFRLLTSFLIAAELNLKCGNDDIRKLIRFIFLFILLGSFDVSTSNISVV